MTDRRNPLSMLQDQSGSPSGVENPPSVLDQIPLVAPRHKNRSYEKHHRAWTYQVPKSLWPKAAEIRESLAGIAESGCASADQVAAQFILLAVQHVQQGELHIEGHPDPLRQKMAVIPREVEGGWPQVVPQRKGKPKGKSQERKTFYLGYRWPQAVHQQIRSLAGETLALGEVVVVLLEHSLDAYREGRLRLEFQPIPTRQEARGEWA
jgi:hypothetical protein